MKIASVLTVACAAAVMTFAANAAERPSRSELSLSSSHAMRAAKKPATPAVTQEKCPYLFGCGENDNAKDAAKSASTGKKGKKASRKSNVSAEASGSQYRDIIAKYSAAYGVPMSLAHAVIHVESNFRPNARGSAGEVGLMQIKPATARMMGYSGSTKGLFNPDTNIKFGLKYLSMAHELSGGTTCGTILKYNAGHAAKRMNKRSSAYCAKVKRLMGGA